MPPDLTELANDADRFTFHVGEFAAAEARQGVGRNMDQYDRRIARAIREGARRTLGVSDELLRDWLTFLAERNHYTRDDQRARLDSLLTVAADGLALVARGRSLWVRFADVSGRSEPSPDLDRAEVVCQQVQDQVGLALARLSGPFVPLDPDRFAEAMRPDREARWVPADEAIARFRDARK